MTERSERQQAVELLQQLGLKEYEARCFVALSRLSRGTAREVSETSDVPRTRVYEAVKVLEAKGLVEKQDSSPQRFRAVPIDEAAETLRREYEARTSELVEAVRGIEPAGDDGDGEVTHEVWTLSGAGAIATRTRELVDGAEREVVLALGSEVGPADALLDRLRTACEDGVDVVVAAPTADLGERVEAAVPSAAVVVTEAPWLVAPPALPDDDTTIGRLVVVDGSTMLVSTLYDADGGDDGRGDERAVVGRGVDNGIVAIARRLAATGFPPADGGTAPE